MKGTLKKIYAKEFTSKEKGNKFKKIILECECEKENGDIANYKGSMSEDYAKRYFQYCKLTTKDAIGAKVEVVLGKRKFVAENEERTYTYIKFINFLDNDGKPIIMKKEDETTDLGF